MTFQNHVGLVPENKAITPKSLCKKRQNCKTSHFPCFPSENPDFFRLQRLPDTSKSAPKDRTVRMLRSASVDTALASAMDTRMDMLTCLGRQMKMGMEMRMKRGAFNVIYVNLSL